jgi:glycosyltransferase involved in cell wall biosynthesis
MHVLFLHQSFPGQFGRFALEMKRRHGWRCSFLVEGEGTCPAPTAEERAELPVYRIRRVPPRGEHIAWRETSRRIFEQGLMVYEGLAERPELEPDLIVAHPMLAPTLFLPEIIRCPLVHYCEYYYGQHHRDMTYRIDLPPAAAAAFYPRSINAPFLLELLTCDAGYSATHWQRSTYPARFQPGIEVHFDGIDTELYRPDRVSRDEAASLLAGCSVPEGTQVVTFVSRGLESVRGFDLFMQVARRISRLRSHVLFVVVGAEQSSYGMDYLHTGHWSFMQWVLKQEEYDRSRFIFLGQIEPARLARLLCLSSLHFYLTVPFVLSWSLFNALSCARVVLASDVAPVRELIEPGVNGLVEALPDVEGLTATALRVLDNPAEYQPLAQAGRQRIESQYSLEVCHPKLKDYFERMAASGGRKQDTEEPASRAPSAPILPQSEKQGEDRVRILPRAPFNICIMRWPGPVPFFEAYREVAETVRHGLERLGYAAVLSEDLVRGDSVNIVFGGHILREDALPELPARTVFYNLEQVPATAPGLKPQLCGQFPVWDYSLRNVAGFRNLGATWVVHVPIGFVPEMQRIEPAAEQDIDVLFYGSLHERRVRILDALRSAGLKVEALQGVYGVERDRFIARAKVVLNMHVIPTHIFEIVRVSYLLANAKAVVSEVCDDTEIEADVASAVVLAEYDGLVDACVEMVRDADRRRTYEARGQAIMMARDECAYLRAALAETWPGQGW